MHIQDWDKELYSPEWIEFTPNIAILEEYVCGFAGNLYRLIKHKTKGYQSKYIPARRWFGGSHGIHCQCYCCANIARGHHNYIAGYYGGKDHYHINVVELGIINPNNEECEIEITKCAPCLKYKYNLSEAQFIRLLKSKRPWRVPKNVYNENTFFSAFKAGLCSPG